MPPTSLLISDVGNLFARSLLAQFIVICLLFISYILSTRISQNHTLSTRLCSLYIISCWLLTAVFHILISCRVFALLPAAIMIIVLAYFVWHRYPYAHQHLYDGYRDFQRKCLNLKESISFLQVLPLLPFLLLSMILLARIFIFPLSGWDALTLHALKAAWWVQNGADIDFNAPGAWEYFRTYFAGGSIFTAWAMLLFDSTFLAGLPDFIHWVGLGLTIYAIAREFQTPRWLSAYIAMMLLSTLEMTQYVGAGHVDTGHNALFFGGVLFLCRFFRLKRIGELILASAAFGVAISVKITGLSAFFLCCTLCIIFICQHKVDFNHRIWRGIIISSVVFLLPFSRWFLVNYQLTGYPLGSLPITVGPVRLGIIPPNYEWLLSRPDIHPYSLKDELIVLVRSSWRYRDFLFFSLFGLIGMRHQWQLRPWHSAILLCAIIGTIAFFISPAFSVHRLGWPGNMGRFLLPCLALPAAAGMGWLAKKHKSILAFSMFVFLSICLSIFWYGYFYLTLMTSIENLFTIAILFLIALSIIAIIFFSLQISRKRPIFACLATMVVISMTLICMQISRTWLYTNAYNPRIPHPYVNKALLALKVEPHNNKIIAVTAGAWNIAQQWFVYPFLGEKFENSICYVSPEGNGNILPHHPDYLKRANPNYVAWMIRLRQRGVTHVMSFLPATGELNWMEMNPKLFVPLTGSKGQWGLFRYEYP